MNKKIIITFLLIAFTIWSNNLLCQDTLNNKRLFLLNVGAHYSHIYRAKYVQSHPGGTFDTNPLYVGYYMKPTFSYHAGISYQYYLKKWFSGIIGIQYFNRSSSNYRTEESVIFYEQLYSYKFALLWKNSSNSIEVPIYLSFNIKRFSINIGCKFEILSFQHYSITYIEKEKVSVWKFNAFGKSSDFEYISFKLKYKLLKDKNLFIYISNDDSSFPRNDISLGFQFKI